jgi:uncharacterized protein YbjQ (UPF0145 family)
MKRKFVAFFIILPAMILTSCLGPQMVGRATINTVYWPDLALKRDNYEVLNRLTATATITYDASRMMKPKILGENNEFQVVIKRFGPVIDFGILKFGYLAGDVGKTTETVKGIFKKQTGLITYIPADPEVIARQLATYRIINEAKAIGADALIEPIISSDVASVGKRTSVIKTTISAKAVIIKLDK